jgi:chemotaxis protein CheX
MTAALAALDQETLQLIVGDVFTGLLGDVEPPDVAFAAEPDNLPVRASVSISGEWNGTVVVACSTPLARLVTAQLLLTTDADLVDDDVRDAVSELANVIGGNVKSVMPGPSVLSLPSSSLGEASVSPAPSDGPASSIRLAWRAEPLQVSVWATDVEVGR